MGYITETDERDTYLVARDCPSCKQQNPSLPVRTEDLNSYMSGTKIQDAFPYLTVDERETVITGFCNACWTKLFPREDSSF